MDGPPPELITAQGVAARRLAIKGIAQRQYAFAQALKLS
jgi:hypothetical protein